MDWGQVIGVIGGVIATIIAAVFGGVVKLQRSQLAQVNRMLKAQGAREIQAAGHAASAPPAPAPAQAQVGVTSATTTGQWSCIVADGRGCEVQREVTALTARVAALEPTILHITEAMRELDARLSQWMGRTEKLRDQMIEVEVERRIGRRKHGSPEPPSSGKSIGRG